MNGFENIEHACLTDVGVRRSHNQDNHAILLAGEEEGWRIQGHVFVVADGMGGHAVGELASQQAVGVIPHIYHKCAHIGTVKALRNAFQEANSGIFNKGQQNKEFEGMGTTATTLVIKPDGAWIGHVGDSRVYRIRAGAIEQLTYDHSLAWEIARQRRMDPEEVDVPSNVLIRSLGPTASVQSDVEGPHPIQEGDIFLLCSDGLSGQVTDNEIGAVVSVLSPAEACRFLVDLANLRGGPDNVTVMIVRIGAKSASPAGNHQPTPAAPTAAPLPKKKKTPVPWPLVALAIGMMLSVLAIVFYFQSSPIVLPTFLLAVGVIVAGFVGLYLEHQREQTEVEEEAPKLRIHRRADCRVDRVLVEKLAKATHALHQRTSVRHSDRDKETFHNHITQAEQFLNNQDYPLSFREYCRAMRCVADVLQREKQKGEAFPPVMEE